jgi:hypothetical protein
VGRLTIFLMAAVMAAAAKPSLDLSSWRPHWTSYRIIDPSGRERQLLKADIDTGTTTAPYSRLVLRDWTSGAVLDSETIPAGKTGEWAHGFWIPADAAPSKVILEWVKADGAVLGERETTLPQRPAAMRLPLRMDRLANGLDARLAAREEASSGGAADVAAYIGQHDIVYRHPAPSWVEGLPLGNGDVGALVSGVEGREQTIHFDKTDLWYATQEGSPLGRSYAGTLRVNYTPQRRGPFEQRLSLGAARVTTSDGSMSADARVHARHNRVEASYSGSRAFEFTLERAPVTMWQDPRGYHNAERAYGSWWTGMTEEARKAAIAAADAAPHSRVTWMRQGPVCSFVHQLPNMSYAVSLRIDGARKLEWTGAGCHVRAMASGAAAMKVVLAMATSREGTDPLAHSRMLLDGGSEAEHDEWWRRFWARSWIELPDKLEENLWYIGLYQQAACSRSAQAVSFFGLWHPLDYRTWYDAYVADAQVPMMWWQTFASNHLELLYPSHRTFGSLAAEFARNTPGEGMVVPHFFFPEWAGGKEFQTGRNTHVGSVPWFLLNFWWDYLYSGDGEFLREVTYPMMRMAADYLTGYLEKDADGRYHARHSQSPEQDNTPDDNTYDWSMLTSFYRGTIEASRVLGVDEEARAAWQERLDNLFPLPADGNALWETAGNRQPYRCHPVVFFSLFPGWHIEPGTPLFEAARRTVPVLSTPLGFRYEDRHAAIPDYQGGIEPNGFSSGILTITAARLEDRALYERFLYGLIVRFHLKQNGLRALIDTRQSEDISRSSLVEAANAHTTAISESLMQSFHDHIRLFPCAPGKGRVRFAGLRAAGGFVVAAEMNDGAFRWARVRSLNGAHLRMELPGGGRAIDQETQPGGVYDFRGTGQGIDLTLPAAERRREARSVAVSKVDGAAAVGLLQYPEDLPFAQPVDDGFLYLGRPLAPAARTGVRGPEPATVAAMAASADWKQRQEAARLLGRSAKGIEQLDRLCRDPMVLVAHTAVVSLVRVGTPEAMGRAKACADSVTTPGLRREWEKARRRMNR